MILTGVEWYCVAKTPGWNLSSGSGERVFRSADIKFGSPFTAPPTVHLALGGVDITGGVRVTLQEFDVEPGEFNIQIGTWDDTAIHQLWVRWIAFG